MAIKTTKKHLVAGKFLTNQEILERHNIQSINQTHEVREDLNDLIEKRRLGTESETFQRVIKMFEMSEKTLKPEVCLFPQLIDKADVATLEYLKNQAESFKKDRQGCYADQAFETLDTYYNDSNSAYCKETLRLLPTRLLMFNSFKVINQRFILVQQQPYNSAQLLIHRSTLDADFRCSGPHLLGGPHQVIIEYYLPFEPNPTPNIDYFRSPPTQIPLGLQANGVTHFSRMDDLVRLHSFPEVYDIEVKNATRTELDQIKAVVKTRQEKTNSSRS